MKLLILVFSFIFVGCSSMDKVKRTTAASSDGSEKTILSKTFSAAECSSMLAYDHLSTQKINTDKDGKIIANNIYYQNIKSDSGTLYAQALLGDSVIYLSQNRTDIIECIPGHTKTLSVTDCSKDFSYNPAVTRERNTDKKGVVISDEKYYSRFSDNKVYKLKYSGANQAVYEGVDGQENIECNYYSPAYKPAVYKKPSPPSYYPAPKGYNDYKNGSAPSYSAPKPTYTAPAPAPKYNSKKKPTYQPYIPPKPYNNKYGD